MAITTHLTDLEVTPPGHSRKKFGQGIDAVFHSSNIQGVLGKFPWLFYPAWSG